MQKNEKFAFVMGVSVGVATISLVGLGVFGVLFFKNNNSKSLIVKTADKQELQKNTRILR